MKRGKIVDRRISLSFSRRSRNCNSVPAVQNEITQPWVRSQHRLHHRRECTDCLRIWIAHKPRGLQAARKLRLSRKWNRWVRPHSLARSIRTHSYSVSSPRPIKHTRSVHWATSTRPLRQLVHRTLKASSSRKSVSKPSSPTQLFGNASVCS